MKNFTGRLKDKVAFISGGTSGIGLATAKDFIKEGASVIITGRYKNTVDKTVEILGSGAHGIVSDAGNMTDVIQLKNQVMRFAPTIDILFANAGYGRFAPVEAVSEKMFDELFNVLVKGTFFTIQQLLPIINENGSVIFNTSVVTEYGSQNASVYSAAKSSVQSLVKTLAAEFTSKKIRVNAVSPGYTETDAFNKTGLTTGQIADIRQLVIPVLPFKRFADPSEIAKVVSFLASDDSSYIHATEIIADGGYSTIR